MVDIVFNYQQKHQSSASLAIFDGKGRHYLALPRDEWTNDRCKVRLPQQNIRHLNCHFPNPTLFFSNSNGVTAPHKSLSIHKHASRACWYTCSIYVCRSVLVNVPLIRSLSNDVKQQTKEICKLFFEIYCLKLLQHPQGPMIRIGWLYRSPLVE